MHFIWLQLQMQAKNSQDSPTVRRHRRAARASGCAQWQQGDTRRHIFIFLFHLKTLFIDADRNLVIYLCVLVALRPLGRRRGWLAYILPQSGLSLSLSLAPSLPHSLSHLSAGKCLSRVHSSSNKIEIQLQQQQQPFEKRQTKCWDKHWPKNWPVPRNGRREQG